MKKLYYTEGPRIMGCGIAGQFKIGVPKEVSDDLAEILIRKGRLKEYQENQQKERGHDAEARRDRIVSPEAKKGKEE